MPYVIIARDEPGSVSLRNEVRPVHLESMTANLSKILGAFADDADTTVHGGVIVYDCEEPSEAEGLRRERSVHPGGACSIASPSAAAARRSSTTSG